MVNNCKGDSRNVRSAAGRSVGRRRFLKATGAGAVTLGLAGCADNGGEFDDSTFKVGHLAPLELDMGAGSERSADIAVDELNANGGVMDTDVELIHADTSAIPSEATRQAETLVQDENVDMLIGAHASEVVLAILDFVAESEIPFLVTGSAAPEVSTNYMGDDYDRYEMIFRPGPANSSYQVDELAGYAEYLNDEHGWTTFAQLAEQAAWTQFFTDNLPPALEDRGFDVEYNERISSETDDFSPILDAIEATGADAVFKQFSLLPGTGMLSEWRNSEYPFGQEGVSVPSMSPEYWDDTDGGCQYETTAESGGAGASPITDLTQPFTEEYEAVADGERPTLPMYMGYCTYDGLMLYAEAVERAGTFDYRNNLQDILDELRATDFTGTTGQIVFGEEGSEFPNDVIAGPDGGAGFPVTQWIDGSKEIVYPRDIASADHQAAPWI
ncbi:ABC-type transport system periplasmic substrate-binding protein (probable substrate branched-chain amino acids) [Natronomonas pharaonis DSM 2160]|uniref:ABC-type transport system periplasmic substrate-binding protein (Probable substrate branched-chain amino acids) n=2 Tax=Natronomonas pharaonis TaxID=2257 RepID=A0A1U7EUZ6_NATPD|nr:ABC-type transport system periplasmic substrate-binding protein (probable substrate branched-chain amino acids) [Natronomonas pharaonis DSM 2160]